MKKIVELNKPKKQYDNIQKQYRCNRCDKIWDKSHTKNCAWYKELIELQNIKRR